MEPQDLILTILTGGILGAVGQGVRVIVGLKKVYDLSLQKGSVFKDSFDGSSLLFSLLIGFVAGVLGVIGMEDFDNLEIGKESILMLIGIGYAGADFIEGFIKKNTEQFKTGASGGGAGFSPSNDPEPPANG